MGIFLGARNVQKGYFEDRFRIVWPLYEYLQNNIGLDLLDPTTEALNSINNLKS